MANFTAVKTGGWAFREKLTSTQITGLQERLLKCPNFSDGSTHPLTGALVVNQGTGGSFGLHVPLTLGDGTNLTRVTSRATVNSAPITRNEGASFTLNRSPLGSFFRVYATAGGIICSIPHSGYEVGDELTILNAGTTAFSVRDAVNGGTQGNIAVLTEFQIAIVKLMPGPIWITTYKGTCVNGGAV